MPKLANGHVSMILYGDGPEYVVVLFGKERVEYDYEEFLYTWTDKYNGCFILNNDHRG